MSQSPMSVRAAVDTINENLSNAIPELVLLLVALQEANRAPPPQVPDAVEAVAKAAEVLAAIATSLANDEYPEHPKIQQEILEAAKDVTASVTRIRQSVVQLSKGDFRNGYTNLMESARVIGGTCIKVLAIVYGASFKRMNAVAYDTNAAADMLDSHNANGDPEKFVQDLSKAATSANQLAAYIRQQADQEESEVTKKEMRDAADKLEKASDNLIEKCNNYMDDLDSEPKRRELEDEIKRFRATVDEAMQPVRSREKEVVESTAHAVAAANKTRTPPPSRSPPAVASARSAVPTLGPVGSDLQAEGQKQIEGLRALQRMVEEERPQEAVGLARELAQRQPVLLNDARDAALHSGDKTHEKGVEDACRQLEGLLPQVLADTKRGLQDPSARPELKRKVAEAENAVRRATASPRSHAGGDGALPARTLAETALDELDGLCRAVGRGAKAPECQVLAGRVTDACKKLNDPKIDSAAKVVQDAARSPPTVPPAAVPLRNLLEDVEHRKLSPQQLAEALRELDALVRAVQAGAPDRDIEAGIGRLTNACRGAGGDTPSALQKVVDDARARDLEKLPPDAQRLRDALNNCPLLPGTRLPDRLRAQALDDVDNLVKAVGSNAPPPEISALASRLVDDVARLAPGPEVDHALKDMLEAVRVKPGDVPPTGEVLKEAIRNMPIGAAQVEAAVRSVIPPLEDAVRKLSPSDTAAIKQKNQEAGNSLEAIANEMDVRPEEQVAADVERLIDAYSGLPTSAKKGDKKGVADGARDLTDKQPRVLSDAQRIAAQPGKNEMGEEVAEIMKTIEPLLPKAIADSKALSDNPNDVERRSVADRDNRSARTALDALRDAICPLPEVAASDEQKEVLEAIEELKQAIARGDVEAAKRALAKLKEALRKFRENARRTALACDAAKAKQALEALRRLDDIMDALKKSTDAWCKDPKNPKLRADEDKKIKDLADAVHDIDRILDLSLRGAAAREKHALDLMAAASDRHDPQDAVKRAKDVMGRQQTVLECCRALMQRQKDPQAKRATEKVAADLEQLLPGTVAAMKDALKAPSGDADDELHDRVQEMQDKLDELVGLCDAGTPKGDAAAAIARGHQAASALTRAAKAKDAAGAKAAAAAAKTAADDLKRIAPQAPGGWNRNPTKVNDLINKFEGLAKDGAAAAANIPKGPAEAKAAAEIGRNMHEPLDGLTEELNGIRAPDAEARSRIRAAAALARKGALSGNKGDLEALLKACKDLADMLSRLSGLGREQMLMGKDSNASLELLELIKSLEAGKNPPRGANLDKAFAAMAGGQKGAGSDDVASVITHVAGQIEQAIADHKRQMGSNGPSEYQDLIDALMKLAEAARNGNKQQMLVMARAIAAFVAKIVEELTKVAEKCKDPIYKDRIIRSLQAMKNFTVQLKIVVAVKVASRDEDKDADEQIKSCVTSLGNALTDTLHSVQVVKKAGLLRP